MSKRIIYLLIEGLGVSQSYRGNAVFSSNPKNYLSLLSKYPYTFISPFSGKELENKNYINDSLYFSKLANGSECLSDFEYLNCEFRSDIYQNSKFKGAIDQVVKNNSALHLVGNLSDSAGRYGDINHLTKILKFAKSQGVFKAYIHLFLDNTGTKKVDDVLRMNNKLKNALNEIGLGEVASIIGNNYFNKNFLNSKNFIEIKKTIYRGVGRTALTSEQAIAMSDTKKNQFFESPPFSVKQRRKPVGTVNDFDVIFFYNHNNQGLKNFISSLLNNNIRLTEKNFLKFITFYPLPSIHSLDIDIIFDEQKKSTLADSLSSKNISQIYLSDYLRKSDLESSLYDVNSDHVTAKYIDGSSERDIGKIISIYFKLLKNIIEKSNMGFIFLDIPLFNYVKGSHFSRIVAAAKALDANLSGIDDFAFRHDASVVLTSNYGGLEQIANNDEFEDLNEKTKNPVPFILIDSKYQNKNILFSNPSQNDDIMYNILRKKERVIDILPTILDIFAIDDKLNIEGKSFLNKFKKG